ncbi:MAG: hypothetical protein NTX15_03745, partial [Candidatus Kapabacteria bacterium]|nr:hypothetical protein [Candidatus Kapabacteria bacterium]
YSLNRIRELDSSSVEYVGTCFQWAMKLGSYVCRRPSDIGKRTMARVGMLPDKKWMSSMTQAPFLGFIANESYAKLNLTNDAAACTEGAFRVQMLIGDDDGLFDDAHRAVWENILGAKSCRRVPQASHTVFIDRPDVVVDAIREVAGK